MTPLSGSRRPLSNIARRTAEAALERAAAEARSMPGNLLPHERLDDLTAAARRIVDEVEPLPETSYDLVGSGAGAVDATVAGLLAGRRLKLPLPQLGLGLFLMDIGKLTLPPRIVDKAGPLDDAELELMRRHPEHGVDLLCCEDIGSEALAVIRFHHERWDGSGYPAGLAGAQTPLPARVAGLADALAGAPSQPAGVEALRAGAGRAFDPALVEVFEQVARTRPAGVDTAAAAAA